MATPTITTLVPTPIERVLSPFRHFAHTASSGGIVLLLTTVAALVWANSPWWESYHHLWETEVGVNWGGRALNLSLHHFINDGLMVVFFFLVGLEIKREILVGELASVKAAALPIAGAIGGMVVPAALYALVNAGGVGAPGWGIPMATDIAFALGILALMGPRIPLPLKVFLAASAIVDDLGAVLVIAFFYTANIDLTALGAGGLLLLLLIGLNRAGVRHPGAYAFVGIFLWVAFLASGVHATIAGVLLALTIPARTRVDTEYFYTRGKAILQEFDAAGVEGKSVLTNEGQQAAIQAMEDNCEKAQAPLQRLEHGLHLWVAFGIIPLFALANAGVHLTGSLADSLTHPVSLGIILGLVVGKPLGITLCSWLAVRSGVALLPAGVGWRAILGVGFVAGIGFTMSLFVAGLAFGMESPLLDTAKIGILSASVLAAAVGWMLLRSVGTPTARATVPPAH